MNKKNIWIILYIGALFVFYMLSSHYFNPYSIEDSYYNYTNIIRYLNDRTHELPYSNDKDTLELYNNIKKLLDQTTNEIEDSYDDLEAGYKKGEYTFEEYYGRKSEYKSYLNRLEITREILEDKVK